MYQAKFKSIPDPDYQHLVATCPRTSFCRTLMIWWWKSKSPMIYKGGSKRKVTFCMGTSQAIVLRSLSLPKLIERAKLRNVSCVLTAPIFIIGNTLLRTRTRDKLKQLLQAQVETLSGQMFRPSFWASKLRNGWSVQSWISTGSTHIPSQLRLRVLTNLTN